MFGFGSPRYFAITGNQWGEWRDLRADQDAINAIHEKYIAGPARAQQEARQQAQAPKQVIPLLTLSNEQVLERARAARNGALFSSLWAGDTSRYDGDDSRADMALANMLAFWCGRDPEQMDRLFRQSGLYRPKWDERHGRDTYGNLTIAEAIAGCRDVYSGPAAKQGNNTPQVQTSPQPPPEWERPLSFGDVVLPEFPAQCLPPAMRNYVLAVAESIQVSADMAAVAALVVAAICLQKKFVIRGKPDWDEPLNLYSVIVALPAERKSALLQAMTRVLFEFERDANTMLKEDIARYEIERSILEKTVKEYEDKAAKGKNGITIEDAMEKRRELESLQEVKPLRLLADDATMEALASLLADNGGKMALVSAEGGIFEILNGRYSQSINIDVLLKAHAGDKIRIDRKGRPSEYISDPALSVLLTVQPVVLEGLMSNDAFRGRGLTARFLYCIPTSKVGGRSFETQPIPAECVANYRGMVYSLLVIQQEDKPRVIDLSPEAYRLSAEFAAELEPRLRGDLETIGDWAGKYHGAVLRIAGVLHVVQQAMADPQAPVSGQTMADAIAIGRYFLEHAKAAYMLMGADEQTTGAKHVLHQLQKRGAYSEVKRYDLFKMSRSAKIKRPDDIAPIIEVLEDYGYLRECEQEDRQGAGRKPDKRYKINPALYEMVV